MLAETLRTDPRMRVAIATDPDEFLRSDALPRQQLIVFNYKNFHTNKFLMSKLLSFYNYGNQQRPISLRR